MFVFDIHVHVNMYIEINIKADQSKYVKADQSKYARPPNLFDENFFSQVEIFDFLSYPYRRKENKTAKLGFWYGDPKIIFDGSCQSLGHILISISSLCNLYNIFVEESSSFPQ